MGGVEDEVYLTEMQGRLPSDLYVHVPKLVSLYPQIEALVAVPKGLPELLRKGIYFALLQSVVRLLERHTDPLLPEILPEYRELIRSVSETYSLLRPEPESNWLSECIQYGDKSAYHWEWKHFDSHELF
ncbi:LIC_11502 family protein [Leptospira bandrabouensis]|uniref:Uncharacterized protein n=1 Tax=Leptospira bandrabouensis TaxID=2484903 RepID=A0A6H3NTK7_9LEPT|nr:hypothetical protein [Leptospira bandrabouensis]MCG6146036.1 hypothetical protein [Leptospira bandrabouensis]MCG6153599.1 hypothetical protein [Leptospira bandrabouensis]MCG6165623.1 hypothetical protein [Leptospira bandrabouensis]MCW7458472.1 hypothetical protein [Leptospira bandrabouensis]MCW7478781.1 hypothetical protein [Leptospira bandrabouensis]